MNTHNHQEEFAFLSNSQSDYGGMAKKPRLKTEFILVLLN